MTSLGANEPSGADLINAVKAASESASAGRRKSGLFSLTTATAGERFLAPILGIYLGFAVVRLPEVFAALAIPRLPMILMLIFLGALLLAVPAPAWRTIWEHSTPMRLVGVLLGIAIVTAPIGIWPSESYQFLRDRYFVAVAVFLSCLVFLRDRRTLRLAVAVYTLSVTAVSLDVVKTYDPNGPFYNEDGEVIDPDVIAIRPELKRLQVVGIGLDSNDFGAILATTFPLALWLSVGSFTRRVFWTGCAAIMVMAVVPTQSRGSMLGFLAGATVIIGAGAKGWRRWLTFAMLAAAVGAFLYMASGMGASGRFGDFSGDDYNLTNEGRLFFWRQGMVWMIKRPWGYGISNFPTYFGEMNGPERAAHSSWVQYGMELGVAGLATFIYLCYVTVSGLSKLRRRAAQLVGDMVARDEAILAGHMLAMLAGLLVTGSFLSNAYYPLMYMGLGLGAATLLGRPPQLEEAKAPDPAPPPPTLDGRSGALPRRRLRPLPGQPPAA